MADSLSDPELLVRYYSLRSRNDSGYLLGAGAVRSNADHKWQSKDAGPSDQGAFWRALVSSSLAHRWQSAVEALDSGPGFDFQIHSGFFVSAPPCRGCRLLLPRMYS